MANAAGRACDPFGEVLLIEFSPKQPFGRLPGFFSRLYPDQVPMKSVVIDPLGNTNSVQVDKVGNHTYFTDGWRFLGQYYGITQGAWMCLVYVGDSTFKLTIRSYKWVEWVYPPIPEPLDADFGLAGLNMERGVEIRLLANNLRFPFSSVKFLSFSEYTGDVLTIPKGFYDDALINPGSQIYIVDEYGKLWPAFLRRSEASDSEDCIITRGWARFSHHKGMQQGQKLMFGVTHRQSNQLHFIPVV